MTFTLSSPLTSGLATLVGIVLLFVIFAIVHKDKNYLMTGGILGVVFGLVAWGVGGIYVSETAKHRAIEDARLVRVAEIPEDWQKLHTLLDQTSSMRLRKAYFSKFTESRKAELNPVAYKEFETTFTDEALGGSIREWRAWISEEMIPFLIIDLDEALKGITGESP